MQHDLPVNHIKLHAFFLFIEDYYRIVCYLPNWSFHRKGDTKFTPEYVDPNLCTHIVYAYASLNPENYTIAVSDPIVDLNYGKYSITYQKSLLKYLLYVGVFHT